MFNIITYLSVFISLFSLLFALWQWRQRIKIEHIQLQNLRSIWDLARSYAPYNKEIKYITRSLDDKLVLDKLKVLSEGFFSLVRLITPLYARTLGKNLTYDYIKNMITAGEIGGTWSLKLLLMELPSKKRDPKIESELIESLPDCLRKISEVNNHIISNIIKNCELSLK